MIDYQLIVINLVKQGKNIIFNCMTLSERLQQYKTDLAYINANPKARDVSTRTTRVYADFILILEGLLEATENIEVPPAVYTNIVLDEVPTGAINGSNATFVTLNDFEPGYVSVNINGLEQLPVTHYNTTGTETIILLDAPQTGDILTVSYMRNGTNGIIIDESLIGTVNGVNTTFTTTYEFSSSLVSVTINGLEQLKLTHYTLPNSTTVQFVDPPLAGDQLLITYFKLNT